MHNRPLYFITHPDVVIDPAVPVPRWPLSQRGRERMERVARCDWVRKIEALWCSDEQKAIDAATILAQAIGIPFRQMAELGENDRSATGFLQKAEFEATANAFFARPTESIRRWERAVDAQARIVAAIERIVATTFGSDPVGVISHGGVGALFLSHVTRKPISRRDDQPAGSGGNYFACLMPERTLVHAWLPIDPNTTSVPSKR